MKKAAFEAESSSGIKTTKEISKSNTEESNPGLSLDINGASIKIIHSLLTKNLYLKKYLFLLTFEETGKQSINNILRLMKE